MISGKNVHSDVICRKCQMPRLRTWGLNITFRQDATALVRYQSEIKSQRSPFGAPLSAAVAATHHHISSCWNAGMLGMRRQSNNGLHASLLLPPFPPTHLTYGPPPPRAPPMSQSVTTANRLLRQSLPSIHSSLLSSSPACAQVYRLAIDEERSGVGPINSEHGDWWMTGGGWLCDLHLPSSAYQSAAAVTISI